MANHFVFQDVTINSGDTVKVYQEITEGEKKRVQIFEGIVISIANAGNNKSFVVRKIGVGGIGVEKTFPVNMPGIVQIQVKSHGDVKRAKLYYLRDRIGKAAQRVKAQATHGQAAAAA